MLDDSLQAVNEVFPQRLHLLVQRPHVTALEQGDQVLRALGKQVGDGFLVGTHRMSLSVLLLNQATPCSTSAMARCS
ncbi:hypothetical protein D3C79_961780 [compost metagenome]